MEQIEAYISALPSNRKSAFLELMDVIQTNIPQGFELSYTYGMIGFVPFKISLK